MVILQTNMIYTQYITRLKCNAMSYTSATLRLHTPHPGTTADGFLPYPTLQGTHWLRGSSRQRRVTSQPHKPPHMGVFNPLTSNDTYRGRTAPLTSKRCILYIYSTNIGTEYFKHGIYSPFFPSSKCSLFHNSNVFGSCITHILYTGCTKILKK